MNTISQLRRIFLWQSQNLRKISVILKTANVEILIQISFETYYTIHRKTVILERLFA